MRCTHFGTQENVQLWTAVFTFHCTVRASSPSGSFRASSIAAAGGRRKYVTPEENKAKRGGPKNRLPSLHALDKMAPSTAMVWNAVRAAPVMTGPPDIPSEVRTRQLFAVISTTIVLAFAILSYILRLWARRRSFQKLQADDWLMGAGLLITLEPAICEYLRKDMTLIQVVDGLIRWTSSAQ
jgi:hypothetical protein